MIAGKINQVSPFEGRFSYGRRHPEGSRAEDSSLSLNVSEGRPKIARGVPRLSFSLPFDYPGTSISCAPKSVHFLLGLVRTNPFDPFPLRTRPKDVACR